VVQQAAGDEPLILQSVELPPDVRDVLSASGWWPHRDVSAWLRQVEAGTPAFADRLLVPAVALTVLDEFGGLRFRQLKQPGVPTGCFEVELWPMDGRVFLLHPAAEFLIGATPAEAIVALVRGEQFAEVDDRGNVIAGD
jgi:hypothetical protein